MKSLIEKLLLKNRTIVSADAKECMRLIAERYPIKVHAYPSGSEHQTWIIPPEWNVIKGTLSYEGEIIASHDESPLFVARYSLPFNGRIRKDELRSHAFTNPNIPNAYCYEFRLAYNYQRRLKEWRISMPEERLSKIPDDALIDIEIEVQVKDGEMIVGELNHNGTSGYWFTMLAHYCHVGQANDGLAGVVIMLEALERIRKRHPKPVIGFKVILIPETIGSSVYVANNIDEINNTIGGVFSEMGAADSPLQLVRSRRNNSYIDRVFELTLNSLGKKNVREVKFRNGWGNDELVFDSVSVGIPVVSIDRYPFHAYHTHFDNMDQVNENQLEEIVGILVKLSDYLNADYIPKLKNKTPIYLSRYDLYADWTNDRKGYDLRQQIIDLMDGYTSVIDIALTTESPFDEVKRYIDKFYEFNLIDKFAITPGYAKNTK